MPVTPVPGKGKTEAKLKKSAAELEQSTTVGVNALPGASKSPLAPLVQDPPTELTVTVNALLEYIASVSPRLQMQFGPGPGVLGGRSGIHQLPQYIDELQRDFGTDIYRKILLDAIVKSCDLANRTAILDKPLQVSPGIDVKKEKTGRKRALAEKVAAFVDANFKNMEQDMMAVCFEMLEAMSMGYKLAEQVYELKDLDLPEKAGKQLVLKALKPKPQEAVSMVATAYNEVVGYLPRDPNAGMFAQIYPNDKGEVPGLVAVDKVWRLTYQEENGDPRGQSYLRPAYVPWRLKIGLYPAYEAFLARFAQPSAVLELNGAELPPLMDEDGNITSDPATVIAALLTSLRNFAAGGAMVAPVGVAKLLEAATKGEAYLSAFEVVNNEIRQALTLNELSGVGPKNGTQALGEVHQDTGALLIAMCKQWLANSIREGVVRPLVYYNYGDAGVAVLPYITFGEIAQQDVAEMVNAISTFANANMLAPIQYNEIFDSIHFPKLPQEVVDLLQEAYMAEHRASIQMSNQAGMMPPAGGAPGAPPAGGLPMSPGAPPPGAPKPPAAGPGGNPAGGPPPPGGPGGPGQPPKPGTSTFRPFRNMMARGKQPSA